MDGTRQKAVKELVNQPINEQRGSECRRDERLSVVPQNLGSGSAPPAPRAPGLGWCVDGRPASPGRKHATEAKPAELGNLSEAGADVRAGLTAVIPEPITQSA